MEKKDEIKPKYVTNVAKLYTPKNIRPPIFIIFISYYKEKNNTLLTNKETTNYS